MAHEYQEAGVVSAVNRFPVKSMAGEDIEQTHVGWHGLDGDRRFADPSTDGTLKIWDPHSPEAVATLFGHRSWVLELEPSTTGRGLVSASSDHTARIWDERNPWR